MMTRRKNQNDTKSKSLLGQYLLIFFVTAFTPVAITCVSLFFSFGTLKKEIIISNQASTRLIQQSFDIKINELNNLVIQISEESDLTRYSLQNAPLRAIDTLKQFTSLQEGLTDIFMIVKDDTSIYSSNGKIQKSDLIYHTFMKDLLKNNYSLQQWTEQLTLSSELVYWPTNNLDNNLNYLYLFSPVYSNFQQNSMDTTRTVMFLISQNFLHDLFRSSQTTMEENILLLNSDFEVLSFLAPQATSNEIRNVCALLKNSSPNNQEGYLELENGNLLFFSYSQETDLYYVRFLSKAAAYQPMYRVTILTIIILILVLIIAISLIFWGMRKSYFPIRSLANWMLDKQQEKSEVKNELELFKQAYETTFEKNVSLSQTMNHSMQGLINHLLAALILGNFSTREAFYNACNNLGIRLENPYYYVCSIQFEHSTEEDNESLCDFSQLITIIKENLPDNVQLLAKDMLFDRKTILLINSDNKEPEFCQLLIADIKKRLLEQAGLITSIGIGSPCDSYEQIGKSYLESVNALDYRMIYGKDCMITPDMYQAHLSEITYPSADLEQLHASLLACDAKTTLSIIHRMYKYVKAPGCNLHTAKYICYDIFSALKRMPRFANMGYSHILSQDLDITRLVNFDTVDDFFLALIDIVKKTLGCPEQPAEENMQNASDIGQQLTQYIHSHCFHYDFQINTMAEHFRISPQHMRKLFKNYTGIGISDYISQLKLEKAMQLLKDTDMSLNDIVLEIGNTDVSGFIKFFRKKTGQTPGHYRKWYRED